MIADLKPYAEYKESGSPWLGRMPAHWNLPRLGSVLRERGETNERKQITQVLSVLKDVGVIRYEDKGNIGNKRSEDIGRYKIVRPDDVVMNCMNVIIGSVGRSGYLGCLSPVYYVLTRRSAADSPRYLAAIFSVKPFQLSLVRIGNGILSHRMRIPMELLKSESLPVPPPAEQAAIVRFLDWASGRLERTIRAKRKVIALLNEQKQAIIHRAVTRGLDPSVPLKASGITWLGDIPTHWEVRKLRSLFHMQGSGTTPSGDRYYGGSINWVMSGDLNDSVIRRTKRTVRGQALTAYSTLKLYPPNSLVVAMYGATIGKTGVLGQAACTNQACCVLAQAMPDVNVALIQLILQTAKPHLLREAYGGGQPNINADVVRSLRVPFPPLKEQNAILAHVEKGTSRLNTAIARLEREIDLLREYRTRLIADVVTGKLDVRETAALLPDEAAPDTTEDDADLSDEAEPADEEAAV
jgi:type I restriction enzyme S subunit